MLTGDRVGQSWRRRADQTFEAEKKVESPENVMANDEPSSQNFATSS